MSIEQDFWTYFTNKGLPPESVAGIMGNIYKESKFKTNNLQDDYNKIFNISDEQYTKNIDNGYYQNFINDEAGYGLAQWTYKPFKQDLLKLCQNRKVSISNKEAQFDLLYYHLQSEKIFDALKNIYDIEIATEYFMKNFEKPKDQSQREINERTTYAKKYYQFFNKGGTEKMKYNTNNPPLACMQTHSTCYQNTNKMAVKGVLWHSTGANNKTIKRYVQPSEDDPNYSLLITKIGQNLNGNDWNHISMQAGLNAWIGTLSNGEVAAVQTMPWDYKPWGCGSGSNGSCNNGWIQFEICEDNLIDGSYFMKVYQEACELTAFLCKIYNINPFGKIPFNDKMVPTILCHQDSYQLGLGTNHSDIYHWFNKFGKTMDDVRKDVAKLMGINANNTVTNDSEEELDELENNIIKKGAKGETVRIIQKALQDLGYNIGPKGVDGVFGTATENALKTFQAKNNLVPDGIFNTNTFLIMKKMLIFNPPVSNDEIYRVRKSWAEPNTQVGAYKNLNYAKAMADSMGPEFKVYNSKGHEVYPQISTTSTQNQISQTPMAVSDLLTPAKSYPNVMLASSSKDENGRYSGGRKGDQTGKEVYIVNWYSSGWNYVLRPKTQLLAEKIARSAEAGCANDNIGYNQAARNTLYIEAQKVGLDLSKITTPCDCDCSSFVSICCICAGLSPSIFYANGNMCTTWTLKEACESTGQFMILSGNQYTGQNSYLRRGDILLNASSHATIVLQSGPNAQPYPDNSNNTNNFNNNLTNQYRIRVMVPILNVREKSNSESKVVAQISQNQVYTIIAEEGGFGYLKSKVGWIDLRYTQKI